MLPRQTLLALVLVSLLATGCREAVKQFGELKGLHDELTSKFGDKIFVHINSGVNRGQLSVTYINSALNQRTRQERNRRAEETAQIVKKHYAGSRFVTGIWVMFISETTRFVVIRYSQTVDSYTFDNEGRPLYPAALVDPPRDNEITASYSDGGTDVSASTFQLDGEPGGYGLTVLPHFKLQGDARRTKAPPPAEVSFLVASYSRKPRFSGAVPVEFIADGRPVMQGKATFTGNDAQYCSLKVSYSAFRRLIIAKEASIKLGAKAYPLTPEQLADLQKMEAYVLQ